MSILLTPENATLAVDSRDLVHAPAGASAESATFTQRQARRIVFRLLESISIGELTISDGLGSRSFGDPATGQSGHIIVRDSRFYSMVVCGGGLSAAEAYIRGYWDSPDLVATMQVFASNLAKLESIEGLGAKLLQPVRNAMNWFRRNTRSGSRRNISAHYDLSNDFFALMLDPTMTYSSGRFESDKSTLEQSSLAKYEAICQRLELSASDHVIEVGCGWGGFAEYAAKQYGCRITGTTISAQQFNFAKKRIHDAALSDQVTLLQEDYRDLTGTYDKLVSIEMIEAVGEQFFDVYFRKCCSLLKPAGKMAIQAITIPDHRVDRYRNSVDFIQRYIFPGGFLPSVGGIGKSLAKVTDFRVNLLEDFGGDYATTLALWRENFWANIKQVEELGFDERFIRTWDYYLCYCEAGFRERQIGVSQIVLQRA